MLMVAASIATRSVSEIPNSTGSRLNGLMPDCRHATRYDALSDETSQRQR